MMLFFVDEVMMIVFELFVVDVYVLFIVNVSVSEDMFEYVFIEYL